MEAVQTDLLCPNCAGQCSYSPASRGLSCHSCGDSREIAIDPDVDPAREFHYHPDLPHTEQPVHTGDTTHQCQTCGGAVVFAGPVVSEQCPYCDGSIVLAEQDVSYQTVGMIPFEVEADTAQTNALTWVGKRLAAPSDLGDVVAKGRVAGIYVPFWTFDSAEAIDYMIKYRVKSGKRWVTRTLTGAMKTRFDDLLMPASPHVTPLIRDGILHDFDPDALRPYTPAYLAGFAAEKHHESVKHGLEASGRDKDLLIRNRIKRHSGKNRVTKVSYKTDTTGIKYRRILLPVWILHYTYDGKQMKVVTCGLHGRTFGERPFSMRKLFGYALALSVAAVVIGWIWGASGML
jgi:hypothetical protein